MKRAVFYKFGSLIGLSSTMQTLYDDINGAAKSNVPIMIYGESGTGKELVANEIHMQSNRKDKPFISVNCGAIPENLIESEFFGYKKGAFTGASDNRIGFLEQAGGGTLFLDEIGEISIPMQIKLLRTLDAYPFSPIGSDRRITPSFRLIAATNKNIEDLMHNKILRNDFYYRINVVTINVPPLRERKEDIPSLIDHFLQKYEAGFLCINIPNELMQSLIIYGWPGNVRELQNAVKRFIVTGDFKINQQQILAPEFISLEDEVAQLEINLIKKYMEQCGFKTKLAAEALSINLRTLQRKINQYHLKF